MTAWGTDDVETRIQWFIRDRLLEEDFVGADPLLETHIDSLSLEQLIDFLEEEYRILLDGEDTARANFSSVPVLAAVVRARCKAWVVDQGS